MIIIALALIMVATATLAAITTPVQMDMLKKLMMKMINNNLQTLE